MQCHCQKDRSAANYEDSYDAQREAKRQFVAKVEKLWLEGHTTYEIAEMTDEMPRIVGRNLREIRKRHLRATRRQTDVLVASQVVKIQQAALEGWETSQKPKQVTTTRRQIDEDTVQTTRVTEGSANPAFLNTALRAASAIQKLVDIKPSNAEQTRQAENLGEAVNALMTVLTPDQMATLSQEQLVLLRAAAGRRPAQTLAVSPEAFGASTGEYGNDEFPTAKVIQMASVPEREVAPDQSNDRKSVEHVAKVTPSRVPSDTQDRTAELSLTHSCLTAESRASQETQEITAENDGFQENENPVTFDEGWPATEAELDLAAVG